jgi:rare lipoprotein A
MRQALGLILVSAAMTSCATAERPDSTSAQQRQDVELQRGTAVYYASKFHGRRTASGVHLDNADMVAAHPFLPYGCVVRVRNLRQGSSADVTIVDRGPSARGQRMGIIIDVSQAAARELGFLHHGSAPVEVAIPTRCRTASAG